MHVPPESPVAIIGGGPSGLLSALLLARAGVPCVLFEQHAGLSTHPRAMGITRRTAEIFRQLRLHEQMVAADFSTPETQLILWAKSLAGEELGRAPLPPRESPLSPCAPFHAPQTHTEAVLHQALSAEPLATVAFGHRVRGIRPLPHAVEIDVDAPAGPLVCRAEWVIAADGASSPVRRSLAIPAEGPGDLGHFVNVFFHADPGEILRGRQALLYNILREDLVEFLVSVNGRDLWLMHHFLEPGNETSRPGNEAFVELIRGAFGLPDLRVEILGTAPWVMSPKVAQAFRSDRVFLVGDAAARLSPAGGLGMNTGLQSVHNLVWKLAAVVLGQARPALLDTYEVERRAASLAIMHHTNDNSGEVFRQVDCALRGAFDELRTLLAASHRQHESSDFDISIGYGAVRRFPHAWVRQEGRRISTLDWFGRGFVLLAGPAFASAPDPRWQTIRAVGFEREEAAAELGLTGDGVALVRPDGFVAWSCPRGANPAQVEAAYLAATGAA